MNKIIISFWISLFIVTPTFANSFPDIDTHDYRESIEYLYDNEIIDGYPDGTFKPDAQINRAEFVKMIINAKYDVSEYEDLVDCFPDVSEEWFAEFICLAKDEGIIDGYPDGFFKPEQNINFVEASKILILTQEISYLSDDNSPWYQGFVKTLEENNYVPPSINELEKLITRGELSELLWRIMENKTDQPSVTVIPVIHTVPEWDTYTEDGFSFDHPGWVGYERHGWMYLSDEMKNITGLDTKEYIIVDTYLATYTVWGNTDDALATQVWFSHPLISTETMTINGMPAMKREFRAYPGDVMNGRTVGYDEVILVWTYRNGDQIKVMQFFNAHPPTQDDYIKIYEQLAATVRPA